MHTLPKTRPKSRFEWTDEDLLVAVVARNEDAFRELFARFAPKANALAARVVRNRPLADEVVQEVFLWVWERPSDYRSARGSVRAWIMTLAHRRAVDRVRREEAQRGRALRLAAATPSHGYVADPIRELEESEEEAALRAAIAPALRALPPEQREVVERMYFEGKSGVRIAEELGIPLGTVKSRALLAMRKMRSQLGVC